jgi:hypothetical protein
MFLWGRQSIPNRLSKEVWAKRFMESVAGMPMENRQALGSQKIKHLTFKIQHSANS